MSIGAAMMMIPHMWYTCCIADAGKTWDLAALPSYNGKVNGRVDGDPYRILKGAKNPDAAFTVLSYLIGPASQKLLLTYGGMPARTADQDAFFAAKAKQFPFVTNWDVVKAGLHYPDNPSGDGFMPNYTEAAGRMDTFWSLLQNNGKLNLDDEIAKMQSDLQAIFDKAATK